MLNLVTLLSVVSTKDYQESDVFVDKLKEEWAKVMQLIENDNIIVEDIRITVEADYYYKGKV